MVPLLADDVLRAVLNQARELAEVRDAGGNLLGYFVPADLYKIEVWAESAAAHTDIVRGFQGARAAETVSTTRQLFEHLKALPAATPEMKASLQPYIDSRVQEDRQAWERCRDFIDRGGGGAPPSQPQA